MIFGAHDQFKAGDTVELTVEEASGFLDKLRLMDAPAKPAKVETPTTEETPVATETPTTEETPTEAEADQPRKSKRKPKEPELG
jgi:outer membrane biosynthesis protein TonB